jgi:pimeloyl-ACP methyl ester carboxylesterase
MLAHRLKTIDEHSISCDHYHNGHDKVVIIAHGFFNSKAAPLLQELGQALSDEYDVIIMDFRGHGKSGGRFHWTSKEYLDLQAVLDYAEKHYQKIGVIGFSLGAATSLITATKSEAITSLIAVSAPTAFRKIEYHFWDLDVENELIYGLVGKGGIGKGVRPGPFWQKKHKPIDLVEKIACPVLYIHGEKDWLIKPRHSEQLHKKTNSKKHLAIIKNGPHAEYLIRKNKIETIKLIRGWFKETL